MTRPSRTLGPALCLLLVVIPPGAASDSLSARLRSFHREVPRDAYAQPAQPARFSPGIRVAAPGFFSVQVNVADSGRNILGDAANEPTIAVDPRNPQRMSIGWRQFNTVASNFRQAGYGYTTDGGQTWRFPGVIQPGVFRSDPVLDADGEGRFYYNSLTSSGGDYRCDVFTSVTGGAGWGPGVAARGGDKQWMAVDRTGGPGDGHIYSFWTDTWSICPPGFFTRSVNGGASYEACTIIPGDPFWGTLAVGPAGELYAFGAGGSAFTLARSSTARDSASGVSWEMSVPVNLDGQVVAFAGSTSPNPGGLHGQAWVAVDGSDGPSAGSVYVLCSVERTSVPDPLDVMFARSTDRGLTWSPPVRVNDDAGTSAWQWFGTMSVAPGGRLDVVWLDTRDDPGTVLSSLYYAYSYNGGRTWSPNIRLSQAFDPHLGWPQQDKMGDYFHMVSDEAGAHLAWAATFGGEQNVFYGRITHPFVGVVPDGAGAPPAEPFLGSYPNPFNGISTIQYRLAEPGRVRIAVYDMLGREVSLLADAGEDASLHAVRWDAGARAAGVYFCRLLTEKGARTLRLLLLP
ncbi:MAG: T9SS type A sorting domain-containing protein [Bacteroidota bacterium]